MGRDVLRGCNCGIAPRSGRLRTTGHEEPGFLPPEDEELAQSVERFHNYNGVFVTLCDHSDRDAS
jgi:hypothetical protein